MNDPGGQDGQNQGFNQPFNFGDPTPMGQQPTFGDPTPPGQQPTFGDPTPLGQQPTGDWQQPGGFNPQPTYPSGQLQPAQQFQPGGGQLPGDQTMVAIGDISVTSTTVYTPSGSRPLNEVQWTFTDMSRTSQDIPTWAIVCAIIFFVLCLLGLLFLLAKEEKTAGSVQVTVHGQGFVHTTTIPVSSVAQVADLNARVNYARTLSAAFPGSPSSGSQPSDPQGQQGGQPGQQPGQSW
jgi:hypothetical protein